MYNVYLISTVHTHLDSTAALVSEKSVANGLLVAVTFLAFDGLLPTRVLHDRYQFPRL